MIGSWPKSRKIVPGFSRGGSHVKSSHDRIMALLRKVLSDGLRVVVRHVHPVQSTIQREIGLAVWKIGFVIGGHSEHTRGQHVVLLLTPYGAESTS